MSWRVVPLFVLGLLVGCDCGGTTPSTDAGLDLKVVAPPAARRPLFDPGAAGSQPIDRPLSALVLAWTVVPADEAAGRAQVDVLRASRAALTAAGEAGADRVAEVCGAVLVAERERTLACLRLLGMTESARSLVLLEARARAALPAVSGGVEPPQLPTPAALARQGATYALGQRARGGSRPALNVLLGLVRDPTYTDHGLAVAAVFAALPRWRAKAELQRALTESERWRLYQGR